MTARFDYYYICNRRNNMTHKLLLKTHNTTGMKYLCYTKKEDHISYKGSGKRWKNHIKIHGYDVKTELLLETDNYEKFRDFARKISEDFDIVNSKEWANMRIEDGEGGDTVSDKMWITNGLVDKYHIKTSPVPEGWHKGRSKCVFNDKKYQSEFSKRSDRIKFGETMKNKWLNGEIVRDHSKCGVRGDSNPSKREEVRKKISESRKKPIFFRGIHFGSVGEAADYFEVSRGTITRWLKNENINKAA